jgi:hypothetical protein
MQAIHPEPRANWEQYPPEQFISTVMHHQLRNKVARAHSSIHVYNGFLHKSPLTAGLEVSEPPFGNGKEVTQVRGLFRNMCAAIDDVQHILDDGIQTLPAPYTPHAYILSLVDELRGYISAIHRWAATIHGDAGVGPVRLPHLDNKRLSDIAWEVVKQATDIKYLLDFAQMYAEHLKYGAL